MKKFISITLVLILTFALFGCGKTEEETTTAEATTTTEAEISTVSVTFPEGYTLVQIAEKLEENKVCSAADFVAASQDIATVKETYGYTWLDDIDTENTAFALEGFVFPDTYEFYIGESATSALGRFLQNFDSKITDDMKQKAADMNLTIPQAITLASIVQSECGYAEEMANVASVFVNRIKSSDYGKLQSDVTINYVNDYITDSPYLEGDTSRFAELYNTYKCDGLPAGPVCCPGIEAINAALNPADTDYYYFVTDSDNNYYYANSYEEHLKNCELCGY